MKSISMYLNFLTIIYVEEEDEEEGDKEKEWE